MKINIAKSTLKYKKNNKRINIITSEKNLFESSFKNKIKKIEYVKNSKLKNLIQNSSTLCSQLTITRSISNSLYVSVCVVIRTCKYPSLEKRITVSKCFISFFLRSYLLYFKNYDFCVLFLFTSLSFN